MPPATALSFYRKRQTFETLETERPKSLQTVYRIVKEVVAAIEERVASLETSYYGLNGCPETAVKQWLQPLQKVLSAARCSELTSKLQLEEIYTRQSDITDILQVDEESLIKIQSLVTKAINSVKEGFSEPVYHTRKLLEYMKRYCLSFSPPDGESYLEVATNYEKQIRDLEKAIRFNIENIALMVDKFENGALNIHQFDSSMTKLAQRLKVAHSPVAIMFTAACNSLRNACSGLISWVNADSVYAEYLLHDIQELEVKRDNQIRKSRDAQMKAYRCKFVVKSLKKSMDKCSEQTKKLQPKVEELLERKQQLRTQYKDLLGHLNIKEFRLAQRKVSDKHRNRDEQESFESLQIEVSELISLKETIEKKMSNLELQHKQVCGHQTQTAHNQGELERRAEELTQFRRQAREAESELKRTEISLTRLKEIHLQKTSTETLKKIFFNMPVNVRSVQLTKIKKDRLDKICYIVANEINDNWPKLYRALPFYPTRGDETVAGDIDDIKSRFLRNSAEQALQSLLRWRRMHTRARTDDLREALVGIKRKDILETLELKFSPRRKVPISTVRAPYFTKIFSRNKQVQQYLYY